VRVLKEQELGQRLLVKRFYIQEVRPA
jgi:hypothetical protein